MRAPPAFLGRLQVHPAVPEHRPVDAGHRGEQLLVLVRVADVQQRHHDLRAARAQPATSSRAAAAGSRASMPAALNAAVVVGRRRRADAEQADLDAGGGDDLVGVEQPFAVPAVQVRRQQRDAALLGQLPQQRQADRQIALARHQRGRSHPPERRREQTAAPLDLARVGLLGVGVRPGEEQVATVEDQRRVRLGPRAIQLGRPARDAAQRMHRAAALLVVAGQVRRIQQL
jgi:hypothetical protein